MISQLNYAFVRSYFRCFLCLYSYMRLNYVFALFLLNMLVCLCCMLVCICCIPCAFLYFSLPWAMHERCLGVRRISYRSLSCWIILEILDKSSWVQWQSSQLFYRTLWSSSQKHPSAMCKLYCHIVVRSWYLKQV